MGHEVTRKAPEHARPRVESVEHGGTERKAEATQKADAAHEVRVGFTESVHDRTAPPRPTVNTQAETHSPMQAALSRPEVHSTSAPIGRPIPQPPAVGASEPKKISVDKQLQGLSKWFSFNLKTAHGKLVIREKLSSQQVAAFQRVGDHFVDEIAGRYGKLTCGQFQALVFSAASGHPLSPPELRSQISESTEAPHPEALFILNRIHQSLGGRRLDQKPVTTAEMDEILNIDWIRQPNPNAPAIVSNWVDWLVRGWAPDAYAFTEADAKGEPRPPPITLLPEARKHLVRTLAERGFWQDAAPAVADVKDPSEREELEAIIAEARAKDERPVVNDQPPSAKPWWKFW